MVSVQAWAKQTLQVSRGRLRAGVWKERKDSNQDTWQNNTGTNTTSTDSNLVGLQLVLAR